MGCTEHRFVLVILTIYRHPERQYKSDRSVMISSTAKSSFSAMNRSLRLRAPSHTRISTIKHKPQCESLSPRAPAHRQFSQSIRFAYPRKDSQDKDSINTEATEYSKSGTDDEGARQEDAAFNPDITDPQETKDVAGKGTEGTVSVDVCVGSCICRTAPRIFRRWLAMPRVTFLRALRISLHGVPSQIRMLTCLCSGQEQPPRCQPSKPRS